MVDNSNMPYPKCLGSHKNLGTEPITCEKGPKLGFEYLPTSKTSHCVRTACMAFPKERSDYIFKASSCPGTTKRPTRGALRPPLSQPRFSIDTQGLILFF